MDDLWTGVVADKPTPLSDGLILRQVSKADRRLLIELFSRVHANQDGSPNTAVGTWVADLFDRGHPTIRADLMLVVEDSTTGRIVSSLQLIPQRWRYADVPIEVSSFELAATDSQYRGRGLLKRMVRELSERSVRRGDLVHAVTDILFFQDDIGVEVAITQRAGRGGRFADLPTTPTSWEPVTLRLAGVDDIPVLDRIDRNSQPQTLVSCWRDAKQWRHELGGRSDASMVHDDILVIESNTGPIGYLVIGYGGIPSFPIPAWLPGVPCPEPVISVSRYELLPDVPWFDVTPTALRLLRKHYAADAGEPEGFMLWLGGEHPAYDVLGTVPVRHAPPMGWFLGVPDVPRLLKRIAPVLQRRLVGTAGQGFTGELRLHLYRHGVRLQFTGGTVTDVRPWSESSRRASDASLPTQMFLQLLFGNGTWTELARAFPDSRLHTRTGMTLVPLLFPRCRSNIWPLI
jgi:hypothetical protein